MRFAIALLALIGTADIASAATVDYTVEQTPSTGKWSLYAQVSQGDNYGLDAFGVALLNTTSISIVAPQAYYSDSTGQLDVATAGFTDIRTVSPPGLLPSGGRIISGGQQ